MVLNAKINGNPCELEIPDDEVARIIPPEDLNQKQAAALCGVSRQTFAGWNVPKNQNGRYSLTVLRERMNKSKEVRKA